MRILSTFKRNFLKIVQRVVSTALVVSLCGGLASAANLPSSAKADAAELKRPEKRLVLKMASSAQVSDEALNVAHASHSSHSSHSSHHSHSSHSSHSSHYSG